MERSSRRRTTAPSEELRNFVNHGIKPGEFVYAVVCNDLSAAATHGDLTRVKPMLTWLFSHAPAVCWGNHESVDAWIKAEGRISRLED